MILVYGCLKKCLLIDLSIDINMPDYNACANSHHLCLRVNAESYLMAAQDTGYGSSSAPDPQWIVYSIYRSFIFNPERGYNDSADVAQRIRQAGQTKLKTAMGRSGSLDHRHSVIMAALYCRCRHKHNCQSSLFSQQLRRCCHTCSTVSTARPPLLPVAVL